MQCKGTAGHPCRIHQDELLLSIAHRFFPFLLVTSFARLIPSSFLHSPTPLDFIFIYCTANGCTSLPLFCVRFPKSLKLFTYCNVSSWEELWSLLVFTAGTVSSNAHRCYVQYVAGKQCAHFYRTLPLFCAPLCPPSGQRFLAHSSNVVSDFLTNAPGKTKNVLCELKNAPGTIFTLMNIEKKKTLRLNLKDQKMKNFLKLVNSQPHSSSFVEIWICEKGSNWIRPHWTPSKDK